MHARYFFLLLLLSADFQNLSLQNIISVTLTECQMVWVQFRTDVLEHKSQLAREELRFKLGSLTEWAVSVADPGCQERGVHMFKGVRGLLC